MYSWAHGQSAGWGKARRWFSFYSPRIDQGNSGFGGTGNNYAAGDVISVHLGMW